ncbi:MAG: NifU family protein [Bacteroidetes bacterium]|nr:NifU family protein [Bacteroidota bacterium]
MYNIIIEPTANPKVMKFIAEYNLIPGSLELDRSSDLSELPLAKELLNFPFVEKVFITANFVAISKIDGVAWEQVVDNLKIIISEELQNNPRVYLQQKTEKPTVFAEMTPNPQVMKFVSTKPLIKGVLEIKSKIEAIGVPIAEALFGKFSFVKEIFISDDFIAVTIDTSTQWHIIMVEVRSFINDYISNDGIITEIQPQQPGVVGNRTKDFSETEQKIADILDEFVTPAVEQDGGKISLIEFDEQSKTAKMLMQGACSGCPSSTATLKNGIENLLKQFLPNVIENVEATNA